MMQTLAHLRQSGLDVSMHCIELVSRQDVHDIEDFASALKSSIGCIVPSTDVSDKLVSARKPLTVALASVDDKLALGRAQKASFKTCWSKYESIENIHNSHIVSMMRAVDASTDVSP